MNRFSRIRHHVDMGDVKKRCLEENLAKKNKERQIEEEKILREKIYNSCKSNWREDILDEGMTTSAAYSTTLGTAEGDGTVTTVNAIDASSYSGTINGLLSPDDSFDGNTGSVIRASGTGEGHGGFNVGGNYLAFQGTGTADAANTRFAVLNPIDSTKVDTLQIKAIVGNDSNGGEDPDFSGEELFVMYKTPAMDSAMFLIQRPDGSMPDGVSVTDEPLIGLGAAPDAGLNDYSISIPDYARAEGTQFILIQPFNSGVGFDHYGITNINFKRKAPVNVFVPLDDPSAISFINVGTNEGDPKKRKKKINDQLEASDKYTKSVMGSQFPGQGTRIDGDDPFRSTTVTSDEDIKASPIGKDEVTKSFADFQQGQKKVEVLKTPEQIKAQNDEYYVDLNNMLERDNYSYNDPKIVEIADKIIKLDPTSTDAYFYKIAYYDMNGEQEKGAEVIDQLIKNNPDDPDGYSVRSYYRRQSGDLAGAIEDIEKTIKLNPDSPYISYYEMDLADLKFQEAELETNNAIKDRMESEAGAIETKAHEDYWNNADLYEIEVPEVEPIEVKNWDKNESRSGIIDLYKADYDTAKATISNLPKQSETIGATYNGDNIDYAHLSDINTNIESRDVRFRSPESMSQEELQRSLISLSLQIEGNKGWVNDLGSKKGVVNWVVGAPNYTFNGTKFTGELNNVTYADYEREEKKLEAMVDPKTNRYTGNWRQQLDKANQVLRQLRANAEIKKLNAEQYQLVTQYNKLYNAFMGIDGEAPPEQPSTLYDQMKALYDEEDPEKEIKTELRANGDLKFEKQYKDLMTAWDSADKFSKFITPLKNLSDALLGSKTAQNAKYENYKIAIAKSIMLNKPIRVNPDTIDPSLKTKLVSKLSPSMFLDYDLEQFYKENMGTDEYMYPQGDSSGFGLIPIVSEAIPYADENIYEDEFGKVYINDGSVENSTFQPFKEFYSWQTGLVETIKGGNPLAGRGQAQYQIVVPPDGTEPYLLYKDHAYYNMESLDSGEAPLLNDPAAKFVSWLGNTAHNRGDGDANTGGMAGYPPNIRGDVITKFRVNLTDLPESVRDTIYRHPLLTENPGFVQALKDIAYNKEFEEINKEVNSLAGSKKAHELYTKILEKADIIKDLAIDNVVETIMGELPGKWNMTSASNMLQKYDEFIQGTVFAPDGRAYVPGVIDPDGTIISRINVTDQFAKTQQNNLKNLMSDKSMQVTLKNYLDGKLAKSVFSQNLTEHLRQTSMSGSGYYDPVLANSLGKGSTIDVDAFLNGKISIKKGFVFRPIPTPEFDIKRGYESYKEVAPHWLINTMAKAIDVSNDTAAAGNVLLSLATMTAARQLLRPVRGPANNNQGKQTFAQAMESAPQMPYKIEFNFPEKMLKILRGIGDEDTQKNKPRLGSISSYVGDDATAAATAAAFNRDRRDRNNNRFRVDESNLYERLKKIQFFNPKDIKPTFPENDPPQLDPKTGMHPRYGKQVGRYKKLDPISANAMPPTGDPEIDAMVDNQRTKPKSQLLFNKIKGLRRKG